MRTVLSIVLSLLTWHANAEIFKHTLDNGLNIIVKEDHRAPVAVSMIWYNVGSADEPGGLSGVSHVLEHMMFKGTANNPQGIFSKKIAAIGGQENAFTTHDYTAYFEKIAASQLPISFELEADRMQHLLFNKQEFAKEINVIKEERRLRTDDNPQALAFERYLAAAHLASPYHHPIIGWMTDLQQMTINDIKAWYDNFYTPNNATLVVVGDVSAPEVFNLAKLYFGSITKRPNFTRKQQVEPPSLGEKSLIVYAKVNNPVLIMGFNVPGLTTAADGLEPYALEVVAGILGAGESARLDKNLIRKAHIASNAEVAYDLYTRFSTQFTIVSTPSKAYNLIQLKAALLKEIQSISLKPINDIELKRIKTQIIAQKVFEKDSIFSQAMTLGLLATIGLDINDANDYASKINAVTSDQIQAVVRRYFNETRLTAVQLLPTPKLRTYQ